MNIFCRQFGQAMTEMLIASSFVLVPLFLLVPILGKYIDIQQSAVMASRYSTWQSTVGESTTQSMSAVEDRIFQPVNTPLTYKSSGVEGKPLWRYHDGREMLLGYTPQNVNHNQNFHSLLPYTQGAVNTMNTMFKGLSAVLPGDFHVIDPKGRNSNEISIKVAVPPNYSVMNGSGDSGSLSIDKLAFRAKGQIYTQAWDHVDTKQALKDKLQPLVPTILIDKVLHPKGVDLQTAISVITLSPELATGNLKFGEIDVEALPDDKK